jgi:hypothetical protein
MALTQSEALAWHGIEQQRRAMAADSTGLTKADGRLHDPPGLWAVRDGRIVGNVRDHGNDL